MENQDLAIKFNNFLDNDLKPGTWYNCKDITKQIILTNK